MNPSDYEPERPRGIIDEVEDLCEHHGSVAEVGLEYYEAFLTLSDAEIESLVRAVLNGEAKRARPLVSTEPRVEAPARLVQLTIKTLRLVAIGLFRLDPLTRLGVYKRIGPEPESEVHGALMEKVAAAATRKYRMTTIMSILTAPEPEFHAKNTHYSFGQRVQTSSLP